MAEARRGARFSRAERVALIATDPCEPDLGNSSVGKRRSRVKFIVGPSTALRWRPKLFWEATGGPNNRERQPISGQIELLS